jgi:hypothetical protein
MNHDELRKKFEAELAKPPPSALERAGSFLTFHVHSYDPEWLKREAMRGDADVIDGLEAIEELLALPPSPGVLHRLVMYEGNRMLPDATEETAAAWLRQLTEDLRSWLADYAPPVREG